MIKEYIWELPQNILGWIVKSIYDAQREQYKNFFIYKIKSNSLSACSLGRYIIIPQLYVYDEDIMHEYGHQLQSKKYGWLYLIIVGIPSLINNIISRIWEVSDKWYYSRWPERDADRLGGVNRQYQD